MAVQGLKSQIADILNAITAQLAAVTTLDTNNIKLVRMTQSVRLSGDRDILLRLTNLRPIPGLMEAAAEVTPAVTRALAVQLRSRWLGDLSDRADNWYLKQPNILGGDPTYGQSYFEELVINALCPFRPIGVNGDVLTLDCMLLIDGTEYRDELKGIPPDDPTWGSSMLVFSINYFVTTNSTFQQ